MRHEAYQRLLKAMQNGESWQEETHSYSNDGKEYWLLQTASVIKEPDGSPSHYVIHASDNTQLHQANETIEQLAFYDSLTNLPNRRLLLDRLEHAIENALGHHEVVAVMMCDLDNFKAINDSLGHEAGDALLQVVARKFEHTVRKVDTVSRLGGDEFVIVLEGFEHVDRIVDMADQLLAKLAEPVSLMGSMVNISSSIGIAIAPDDGRTAQDIMRNADLAMYHAKSLGKKGFQFFRKEMNEQAIGRLQLENELRQALSGNEFYLVYQPQVDISTGAWLGLEALIRWDHPDGRRVSPAEFIPLAEQTGLIEEIGHWVMQQAVSDWIELKRCDLHEVSLAVNFSAYQFRQPSALIEQVKTLLAHTPQMAPALFKVEITESTLIQDVSEATETLRALKRLGVSISIDDFGTGYSSLTYLKRFPIDELKIDKSFVNDLLVSSSDQAIVSAILAIVKELNIRVVAEGVETDAQREALLEKGCRVAQGYWFHKPLGMAQIKALLPDLQLP